MAALVNDVGAAAVLSAIAKGVAPAAIIGTADWAEANFVLVDGPYQGEVWRREHAPYMVEILRAIDDENVNCVSVRKSAQVTFTTAAIAWLGKNIDTAPAQDMVIFPTLTSVQDFNREKLQPAIEASPALRRKVRAQSSRSSRGSTALTKLYTGGILTLTGANSAADLRSKTRQRQFRDEIDEWPDDLDGQGDPYGMADARLIAHHATRDWKVLEGSTPTIKGASRIDDRFAAGDQRYYEVPCPHCGTFQRLEFGGKDVPHGLKFNREYPFAAYYVCRAGGCVIEHFEKRRMLAGGRFVAMAPGPGRHPSFHIDALSSNLTTWDDLAAAFLDAKDNPLKLRAFVNLWLAESYEERGDAPDWRLQLARRGDYAARVIPPGGLVLTGAADVQQDGIYYEIVAWGRGLTSWSIDIGFLPGETASREAPVWDALGEVFERKYPDAYGGLWPADAFAVDAGYQTQVVYDWCRRRRQARAIKGVPGWYRAAIASTPSRVDVTYAGKRVKSGALLWQVGTWPLKSALYTNIRKEGRRDGAEADPPGFCHFTADLHDEAYFRQLFAEHLEERAAKGRRITEWVGAGANHFHDCRIYNMAMAEHLKLGALDGDGWARVAAARGAPETPQQDLFAAPVDPGAPPVSAPAPAPRRRTVIRGR